MSKSKAEVLSGIDQEVSRPEAASLINDKHHGRAYSLRCGCYHIVTPRECMALRYGYDLKHDGTDETCECSCHDAWYEEEREFYREAQL